MIFRLPRRWLRMGERADDGETEEGLYLMPRKRTATEPVTGWLDQEQQRAWLAYIRVQLRLVYEMNRQLQSDSGMSLADWDVLTALGASESASLTVTTLAAQIGWERSRLSHHAKRMASRGAGRTCDRRLRPASHRSPPDR